MDDFLAARSQMALSLGFHIIYSCIGMVMPVFMAISHYKYIKTGNIVYKNITQAWSKGVAIFFATGAVSGTMLSFELGLLWPGFMRHAGPIFGMPFSLEGVAFFIEAIALGFFLYGWNISLAYRRAGWRERHPIGHTCGISQCLDEQSVGI